MIPEFYLINNYFEFVLKVCTTQNSNIGRLTGNLKYMKESGCDDCYINRFRQFSPDPDDLEKTRSTM